VLRYKRHWALKTPFICIEHEPGFAEIIEPRPRAKHAAQLTISKLDHNGREELPVEEWTPRIEKIWARYVAKELRK
jgi:hypothetical protein